MSTRLSTVNMNGLMLFEMPSKQNKKRIKIKSSFLITQYSLWRKKAEYGEGVNVGGDVKQHRCVLDITETSRFVNYPRV